MFVYKWMHVSEWLLTDTCSTLWGVVYFVREPDLTTSCDNIYHSHYLEPYVCIQLLKVKSLLDSPLSK